MAHLHLLVQASKLQYSDRMFSYNHIHGMIFGLSVAYDVVTRRLLRRLRI